MKDSGRQTFGKFLKERRLKAGFGLRRFAGLIEMKASNLCDIEHGRRAMPTEYLETTAEVLGLTEDSPELQKFFDLANEIPPDLRKVIQRKKFVPALLRTIENQRLSDKDIQKLISEIQGGKASNESGE